MGPDDATEEYEDALFTAFAEGVPAADLAGLPDREVVLPWANLRRSTGERKATGLTGALLPDTAEPAPAPTFVVQVPDGDADGANGEPPEPKKRRRPRRGHPGLHLPVPAPTAGDVPTAVAAVVPAEALTADGEARLRAELDELTLVKRPQIIARIRTAKEHGDLKENAEYHAAREEQSFLEGRVQAIEARLRSAVIVAAPRRRVAGRTRLGRDRRRRRRDRQLHHRRRRRVEPEARPHLVVVTGRAGPRRPRRGRRRGRRRRQPGCAATGSSRSRRRAAQASGRGRCSCEAHISNIRA